MYLGKSSCISYQNTISEDPFKLIPIRKLPELKLQEPDYKILLKPILLRRMSKVLKMGTYSAMKMITREDPVKWDAIIVGTGLGCVKDTISFLEQTIHNNEQTLAPTAFIQSTHNSIAGQIALLLENTSYNMTMVQNSLSFETALLDAQLQMEIEGRQHILVGGVDEQTPILQDLLKNLAEAMNTELLLTGEGSAFFNISKETQNDSIAKITKIGISQNGQEDQEFLKSNDIDVAEYDLIFNGGMETGNTEIPQCHFKEFCGEYFTATAFALHLALRVFHNNILLPHINNSGISRILILNKFGAKHGAIAIERV